MCSLINRSMKVRTLGRSDTLVWLWAVSVLPLLQLLLGALYWLEEALCLHWVARLGSHSRLVARTIRALFSRWYPPFKFCPAQVHRSRSEKGNGKRAKEVEIFILCLERFQKLPRGACPSLQETKMIIFIWMQLSHSSFFFCHSACLSCTLFSV